MKMESLLLIGGAGLAAWYLMQQSATAAAASATPATPSHPVSPASSAGASSTAITNQPGEIPVSPVVPYTFPPSQQNTMPYSAMVPPSSFPDQTPQQYAPPVLSANNPILSVPNPVISTITAPPPPDPASYTRQQALYRSDLFPTQGGGSPVQIAQPLYQTPQYANQSDPVTSQGMPTPGPTVQPGIIPVIPSQYSNLNPASVPVQPTYQPVDTSQQSSSVGSPAGWAGGGNYVVVPTIWT